MALVLRVVTAGSCPVTEGETRICDSDRFTIGRGAENDWVIADPDRHLSKQHCRFERRDDGYYIVDTSRNGVFVSGAATALGAGLDQALKNGDDIDLGPCVLRVEFGLPPQPARTVPDRPEPDRPEPDRPMSDITPWTAAVAVMPESPFVPAGAAVGDGFETGSPVAASGDFPPMEPPPAIAASFPVPAPRHATIPADWQADDGVVSSLAPLGASLSPPGDGTAEAAAPMRTALSPGATAKIDAMVAARKTVAAKTGAPGTAPAPGADLLAVFLEGAGLPPDAVDAEDAADTMLKLGQAFREAVGGLRELLELRAFLKSEFHIEHTRLRAKENNPLKFSANLDGTLSVLLGRRVPGFMTPPEAIRESLRDVKAHEVALIAGMKAVIGDLLDQLSPETVQSSVEGRLLPPLFKARCWDRYQQAHQRLAGDQMSGPPLGGRFAQAYTRQFRAH
ncbi:MAG: type VI secretion system-associated FHA domain protein TagH [Telmatospirillum sp.]|nr:type VI secretion system-associated FHA domain protein TagH [Telmatospirillum sp.]